MSFILDALKKSESERQRQLAPGLIDPAFVPRRTGLPLWGIALLTLLFINIVVLSFVLLRRGTAPPAALRAASRPAAPLPGATLPSNAAAAAAAFSPMDSTPRYAPEIPLVETPNGPRGAVPSAGSRLARTPDAARTAAWGVPAAPTAQDEPLPTISEIDFSGTGTPPELHLDVHVYAADPTERFVFINGRKYVEGSVVQDGLRIERIRRDGVAMNYRGKRFLLPRQ